ncbi:MAG: iron ABC transporter permease [Acidobacteriota bacterium]|nr:iron ABC transporter permease [Acidobacteriota bacterium]
MRGIAWPLAGSLVAAWVAVPIMVVLASVGADSDGVWAHLASTVLPGYIRNTVLLALGVAVGTFVLGVGSAWLVTMCRFPGQRVLWWALLLPLAIPAYLSAYAYSDLLQFSGPVQTGLRDAFGWIRADYWFPQVRSLGGAIAILSFGLYPYVYLASRSAFLEQSMCALEVGRTLGGGPWNGFRRIALPLARPSIVAGLSLALMETLAEFGAVDYLAVDTFATGIFRTWMTRGSLTAAAQLSACLLGLVGILILIERSARRRARFFSATHRHRALATVRLRGVRGAVAAMACALPVVLGFAVPVLRFIDLSATGGDRRAGELFVELARNSMLVGLTAAALAAALALVVAYAGRLDPSPASRFTGWLAGLGYAIPGGVIAIGVLAPLTWLDHRLNDWGQAAFDFAPGLILSGSVVAVLLGYQTRFLALALSLIEAGLGRIRPSIDDAARTLGATPGRLLRQVHVPLLRGTTFAALALVFVEVIKELPATLILRPFNFETLAVRVYQLASDERLAEASTGALAIIAVGLVPVVILSRLQQGARPAAADEVSE